MSELTTALDIPSTVHRFMEDRLNEKKRQYHSAVRLSLSCVLVCVAFYLTYLFYPHPFLYLVYCTSFSMGAITISVCPLDELDLDEFSSTHPRLRSIMFLFLAGFNLAHALILFPNARFLAAIPQLWVVFGGSRIHLDHNPRVTTLQSVAFILEIFANSLFNLNIFSPRQIQQEAIPSKSLVSAVARAILYLTTTVFLTAHWIRPRPIARRYPTLRMIEVYYGCLLSNGINEIMQGTPDSHFCPSVPTRCLWRMAGGVVFILPLLMIIVFGRAAVFGFMARRFDRHNAKKDGAFLAELYMMDDSFSPGDQFWLEKEMFTQLVGFDDITHQKLDSLPNDGDRSNWLEGVVIDIELTGNFRVKFRNFPRCIMTFGAQTTESKTVDELLKLNKPRCVEWSNLSFSSMKAYKVGGDVMGNDDFYELSRPLNKDEHIDFFVSHSWRDNAALKWRELGILAEAFNLEIGRYPTFWIDKFCLRTHAGDPTGALQSLSVYIMACDRMIVLCGMSFPSRLWCAWELFTIFAFQHKDQAMRRINLILLGQDNSSGPLEALKKFNVANTTCYSPLDEMRIMKIIDAVGRNEFNEKIHNMVELMIKRAKDKSHEWLPLGINRMGVHLSSRHSLDQLILEAEAI